MNRIPARVRSSWLREVTSKQPLAPFPENSVTGSKIASKLSQNRRPKRHKKKVGKTADYPHYGNDKLGPFGSFKDLEEQTDNTVRKE